MDLFTQAADQQQDNLPLAARMRPQSLEEFVGQSHILGEGKLLRRSIREDRLGSVIFYGPPGTGKTTLAYVISQTTNAEFVQVSATSTNVAELKEIIGQARETRKFFGKKTIVFIDEIHRLNKGQQDVLLPAVENGEVVLIAATTENPFFEVNSALLSRSRIFQLQPLTNRELQTIAQRALTSPRGLRHLQPVVEPEALEHLIRSANGDARVLLTFLEAAVMAAERDEDGRPVVDLATAEDAAQIQRVNYDKSGDNHYDVISAFIKSLRGSDPDAALYWLARMLKANEDPRFIVRRLIVHASEDVGMADPTAMLVAQAAANALEWVGMPEARIPIAQAVIHIATAPKSNSVVTAIGQAMDAVETNTAWPVPRHLRDTHYPGAQQLGSGQGYKYPHDYPEGYVTQHYFPEEMSRKSFYRPSGHGREKYIKERMEYLGKLDTEHKDKN